LIDPLTEVGVIGEQALLRHIRSRIPSWGTGVVLGVGDDAAVVETGATTLVTSDSLVEGVHFRCEWALPTLIGRKVVSVNAADIAAMGGIPRHFVLGLSLRADVKFGFVDGLYDGLLERCAELGVNLVGGSIAATSGPIIIDGTLLGQADRYLRRSGAVAGDRVVVTGTLGSATAGQRLLTQGARLNADGTLESTGLWTESSSSAVLHCLRAHLDPNPPIAVARTLVEHELAHAAIDVSDGLSNDLLALCVASEISAWIDPAWLPIDPRAAGLERARGGDAVSLALHGAEEYQLLLAIPADRLDEAKTQASMWEAQLTEIGEFEAGEPKVSLRSGEKLTPLSCVSIDHFKTAKGTAR
jgi:thiamine-monophosphate kinase